MRLTSKVALVTGATYGIGTTILERLAEEGASVVYRERGRQGNERTDVRHAIAHHHAGTWPKNLARSTVTLAWADRHRRRLMMTDDSGEAFLLDLSDATRLAEGDGLALEGGGWLAVRAAAEAVADIRCAGAEELARIAWHIGNRHAPVQVLAGGILRILDDHVLIAMVHGLGGTVDRLVAPFQPEGGAYEGSVHAHG